jgi:hypothetical protein
MVCAKIRDFIRDFKAKNGELPILEVTPDAEKRLQMDRDRTAWGLKFTHAFSEELGTPIKTVLHRLGAEGQSDVRINPLLERTPFYPDFALELAAVIFKMALRLTLTNQVKSKWGDEEQYPKP